MFSQICCILVSQNFAFSLSGLDSLLKGQIQTLGRLLNHLRKGWFRGANLSRRYSQTGSPASMVVEDH